MRTFTPLVIIMAIALTLTAGAVVGQTAPLDQERLTEVAGVFDRGAALGYDEAAVRAMSPDSALALGILLGYIPCTGSCFYDPGAVCYNGPVPQYHCYYQGEAAATCGPAADRLTKD